jgi:hypothetical protein
VKNWELIIELLRARIFKFLFRSVPSGTFKEESMDVNTLIRCVDSLSFDSSIITLNDILEDLRRVDNLVKRPILGFSLSSNLLLHGSEETLWVEETSKPE